MKKLMDGKGDSLKGILIHRKRLYRHMLRLKLIKRRSPANRKSNGLSLICQGGKEYIHSREYCRTRNGLQQVCLQIDNYNWKRSRRRMNFRGLAGGTREMKPPTNQSIPKPWLTCPPFGCLLSPTTHSTSSIIRTHGPVLFSLYYSIHFYQDPLNSLSKHRKARHVILLPPPISIILLYRPLRQIAAEWPAPSDYVDLF